MTPGEAPAVQAVEKRRWLSAPNIVLFLLCLMYMLTYIDRVIVSTAGPAMQDEFGLNNTELGKVFGWFGWTYAAFQVIGGRLGDRMGPRMTLLVCGSIWALSTMATGLAVGLISLGALRLVLGFGEGATFPTATRAMQSWVPAGRRGWAQGVTHSFARLGNALTPPIVAALMVSITWRGAFVVLGAVSLVWAGVWWLYFRNDPKDHRGITPDDLARLPAPGTKKTAALPVPWRRLILRILPVTLTYFCYGWSLWLFIYWVPTFFQKQYHLDIKKSALFSSGVFLAGVIGDTLGGVISDYLLHRTGRIILSRLSVIIVGMLGSAACMVPILFPHDVVWFAICLSGGFFFLELVIGPIWSVPMDIAPQHSGTASGLMNTGSAVAAIFSPWIGGGYLIDATGKNYAAPFYVAIALLVIGAGLSFTMRPDRKFVDEPAAALPVAKAVESPPV
jgi:MFS family permease